MSASEKICPRITKITAMIQAFSLYESIALANSISNGSQHQPT